MNSLVADVSPGVRIAGSILEIRRLYIYDKGFGDISAAAKMSGTPLFLLTSPADGDNDIIFTSTEVGMKKFSGATPVVLLISIVLFAGPALAAEISGVVLGPGAAPMPGVTVTVTNPDTGSSEMATTDERGRYVIDVPAGTYDVKAELPGFGSVTRSGVVVGEGGRSGFDLAIRPEVAEEITVTARKVEENLLRCADRHLDRVHRGDRGADRGHLHRGVRGDAERDRPGERDAEPNITIRGISSTPTMSASSRRSASISTRSIWHDRPPSSRA